METQFPREGGFVDIERGGAEVPINNSFGEMPSVSTFSCDGLFMATERKSKEKRKKR